MQNAPLAKSSKTSQTLLFVVFIILGGIAFKALSLQPLLDYMHAKKWVAISCQVDKSELRTSVSHKAGQNRLYEINIEYHYIYNNKTYHGNRYNFLSFYSSGYSGKEEVIKNYPVGKIFTCYIDPKNPSNSVINRSADWYLLFAFVPLLFITIGFAGLLSICIKPEKNIRSSSQNEAGTLQETISQNKNFVVILFITLFWNGCVILMYYNWWLDLYHIHGSIPIFNTLLFGFFVIAGLLLIYGTFYSFLCLFNPNIKIKLNTDKILVGGQYTLNYQLQGRIERLNDISFTLQGKEESSQLCGRNRQTKEFVFYKQKFYQHTQRILAQDETAFEIPEDIMPSFYTLADKITWSIIVEGKIPFWPNMRHEFNINISPKTEE